MADEMHPIQKLAVEDFNFLIKHCGFTLRDFADKRHFDALTTTEQCKDFKHHTVISNTFFYGYGRYRQYVVDHKLEEGKDSDNGSEKGDNT